MKNKFFLTILALFLIALGAISTLLVFKMIKINSDQTDYFAKAQEAKKNMQYSDAITFYGFALDKNPKLTQAYADESEIYLLKNRNEDAINILKKGISSIQASKDKENLEFSLGSIFYLSGDYKNAQDVFEAFIKDNPKNKEVNFYLGKIYFHLKDYAKAKTFFEPMTDFKPAIFEIAVLNYDDPAKSLEYLTKAKSITDINIDEIPQWESDMKAVQTEINNKKSDILIKVLKASALNHANRCEPAVDLLKSAIEDQEKIAPYINARVFLGDCYVKLKDYANAKDILEKTFDLDKSTNQVRELLVSAYKGLNLADKAIDMQKDLVVLNEQNKDYKKDLIAMLIENKKDEDAISYIDQLLKLGDDVDYVYLRAELLIDKLNKPTDALVYLNPFINKSSTPLSSKIEDIYAWALFKNNEAEKALTSINQAIKSDAMNALAYYHRGIILSKNAKNTTYKDDLQKAIDLDVNGDIPDDASKLL